MKKLFPLLIILGTILMSSCSSIPENDDPIIGIWSDIELKAKSKTGKQTTERKEWIFNDVYLGRFHTYNNGVLEVITDFQWSEEDGVYTISYPGLENKTDDIVSMKMVDAENSLLYTDGDVLATRE